MAFTFLKLTRQQFSQHQRVNDSAPKLITKLVADVSPIEDKVGAQYKVGPYITPTDAANKVLTASIDDTTIATTSENNANTGDFIVNLLKAGSTVLHYSTTDGSNITIDVPINVTEV